jgi:RNA polymerase sigma-70 factor (ECF subfamily)
MTSEAAYLPNVLIDTAKLSEAANCTPQIVTELLNTGSSPSVGPHRAGAVVQIPEASDEMLLEQVKEGTQDALALLFRRHARAVRNVAHRVLRNEAEADDLVQDVFLFIYRKATLFDASQGAARTWIIHVTYHRAFDRRRYLNSRHFYTNQELEDTALRLIDPREEVPFYGRSMEGILGKELTARFNARLTLEQRETIHLYFFEGYALKEIAQLTGRSLVNVRNHYYRGLERLRKYILPEKSRPK